MRKYIILAILLLGLTISLCGFRFWPDIKVEYGYSSEAVSIWDSPRTIWE